MAKEVKKKASKEKEDNAGFFIPAGLFLGLGFGALFSRWTVGVLLGLGVGFLGMAIARVWGKNR